MRHTHLNDRRALLIYMVGLFFMVTNLPAITVLPSNPAGADKWWALVTGDEIPVKSHNVEAPTFIHSQKCNWNGMPKSLVINQSSTDGVIATFYQRKTPMEARLLVQDGPAGSRLYWIEVSETTICSCGSSQAFGPVDVKPPS